jgi:HEAT repeat protein
LAYWIHTQGSTGEMEGGTLIDKDELMRQLQKDIKILTKRESHEAKAEAKRFIDDFIQKRTGLLNEQGRDRYAFVHKTFQEYLTAEEIFERADSEDDTEIIFSHFRNHLHDQHWREVLLLLVSKLKGKKAQKAIQAVLDVGSKYEQWLHRDLLFAGWCLTEDPAGLTTVATDWVGGIFDKLVDLEINESDEIGRKIKVEVGRILYCFGETTLEQNLWSKLQERKHDLNCVRLLEFQAKLGQEAEAIDKLLLLLQNEDSTIQARAIEALYSKNVGLEAIKYLTALLDNKDLALKAASCIGYLGYANQEVSFKILPLLQSKNSIVRYHAIHALDISVNSSKEFLNGLLSLAYDEEQEVRCRVIQTFGRLRPNEKIINCLFSLLRDENSNIKLRAIEVLSHIDYMAYFFDQAELNVSRHSELVMQLFSSRYNMQEVIDESLPLLHDDDFKIRFRVGIVLGRLTANHPEVIGCLLSLLQNKNFNIDNYAMVQALSHLNNPNEEVVNELVSFLENSNSNVRYPAAEALIRLGDTNLERAKNTLFLLLEDENSNIRCNAAQVLTRQLGDRSSKVINVLMSCITGTSHDRLYASQILSELKLASSEIVEFWLSLLKDQDSSMRAIAVESLTNLAKTSEAIYPSVLKWLNDNSTTNEIGAAIDCLWSIVVE